MKEVPVLKSQQRSGFLGLLLDLTSIQNIYDNLVVTGRMSYLLTYKLCQVMITASLNYNIHNFPFSLRLLCNCPLRVKVVRFG